jgi:hypothetical protein
MYTLEDGTCLVNSTRKIITNYLKNNKNRIQLNLSNKKFVKKVGVFVTLNTYPNNNLRGCIGYPEPVLSLKDSLEQAAIAAATNDPRFPSIHRKELDSILIEVSILTNPEILPGPPSGYVHEIEIGKHGLIVENRSNRGLLLPQVATEEEWDKEEFISKTCIKAGLFPDAWHDKNTKVYRFQAVIFSEITPDGKVVEKRFYEG